tara:strand:+ start:180 stop:413 length:234 start_codon:yes stop_codon:yes gene_type:complete
MSKIQEENWELMTVLQIPWPDTKSLSKADKAFLLEKATEVKAEIIKQQQQHQAAMEQQQQQNAARQAELQNMAAPSA